MANLIPYGFIGLEDIYADRVIQNNPTVIDDAVRNSAEWHTRTTEETMSLWVETTTQNSEKIILPGSGEMQPLDADGNPIVTKLGGSYSVAYPFKWAGDAYGTNRETQEKMTVGEVARYTLNIQMKDSKWLRRHYLAAVLDNTEWTFDDPEFGDLVIKPLANNDAARYIDKTGSSVAANHYGAQAANISDAANPFPTIFDALENFPSNNVSGANPVVAYVATNLRSQIRGLAGFVGSNEFGVVPGANVSTVDMGAINRFMVSGMRFLGVVDDVIVMEWGQLPAGYMLFWASGAGPFIKMRQEPEAALQGLITEIHSPDGNHRVYRFLRKAGFGVANRVAAYVYQIGNAAYQIPTGYATPLAS